MERGRGEGAFEVKLGLLLFVLASPLSAHWNGELLPFASEHDDWKLETEARKTEAWERLAQKNTPAPELVSVPALLGEDLLWLWQHTISGKDGSHCPHYPSCSRYSRIAVQNYGLVLGV